MRVKEEITDEQALEVGNLFLKNSISNMYNYTFEKITRTKYDTQDGCDAEESVNIYFDGVPKVEEYRVSGWNDVKIMINIIIYDRYTKFTYFGGYRKEEADKTWGTYWLSNHIEVVKYLENLNLIEQK